MSLWEWCKKEFEGITGNEKTRYKASNLSAGIQEIDDVMRIIKKVFPEARILEVRRRAISKHEKPMKQKEFTQASFSFTGYKKGSA